MSGLRDKHGSFAFSVCSVVEVCSAKATSKYCLSMGRSLVGTRQLWSVG